jgi:hypothetical protein
VTSNPSVAPSWEVVHTGPSPTQLGSIKEDRDEKNRYGASTLVTVLIAGLGASGVGVTGAGAVTMTFWEGIDSVLRAE